MARPSFSFFPPFSFQRSPVRRAAVGRRGVSTPRCSLVGSPPHERSTPLFLAHPCLLAVAFRRWIGSFSPFRSPSRPLGAHSGHSPNGRYAFSVDRRGTASPTAYQFGDFTRVKGRFRHKKADFIVLSAKTAWRTPFAPCVAPAFPSSLRR